MLELHDGNSGLIASNNDWKSTRQAAIEASGLAPNNDKESAILATLASGNYTAIVFGAGGTTGVGLIEAYPLDQPQQRLGNNARNPGATLGLVVALARIPHLIRHFLRAVEGAFRPIMLRHWSRSRRGGDWRPTFWLGCGDRILALPLPDKQRRDTQDQKKKRLHGIK